MARALMAADTRLALGLLWIGLAVRLVLAWALPLGLDEAYALAVAREFSLSFFDHPPLGFWLGAATAKVTGIEHALVYRLPYVVLGTVTAAAIWRIARRLGGARAGIAALVLFLVAPHMLAGSGLLVVPDAPLNAAGAMLALLLLRLVDDGERASQAGWLLAGLLLALALASKYHAVFLPLGLVLFSLTTPGQRGLLARPGPWLGMAVGLAGLAPMVAWNAASGWASLAFHGQRTGHAADLGNLATMTGIQALYLLPPVMVLAILGMLRAARPGAPAGERLLLWLALPQIVIFSVIFLFGRYTFAHWPMPGWMMALPLAGLWIAEAGPRAFRRVRVWTGGFAVAVWGLALVAVVHANTGLLSRWSDPLPGWDDTTGLFDWSGLGPALEERGWLDGIEMIASDDWAWGGVMATALQRRYNVRILSSRPHHFAFMAAADLRAPALMLVPGLPAQMSDRIERAERRAHAAGATVTPLGTLILPRGGRPYAAVGVLHLHWADQPPR